jgi:molybdopterin converting factor small subunit
MATVYIPNAFQPMSGGLTQVDVPGRTLRQVFANLEAAYPALKDQIVQDGDIRPGLAIAVDNEITSEGLVSAVEADSEIRILPAVGGGRT